MEKTVIGWATRIHLMQNDILCDKIERGDWWELPMKLPVEGMHPQTSGLRGGSLSRCSPQSPVISECLFSDACPASGFFPRTIFQDMSKEQI